MTTAQLTLGTENSFSKWIREFAGEHVGKWCQACDQILEASRERCFTRELSAAEENQAIVALKYFLRSGRLLMVEADDAGFPDRQMRKQIQNRLLLLEEHLGCLENPMSSEEATRLLAEVFPA